jgi:hypothetical protein
MVSKSSLIPNSELQRVDGIEIHNTLLLNLPDEEWQSVYSKLVFLPIRTHDVLNQDGEAIN